MVKRFALAAALFSSVSLVLGLSPATPASAGGLSAQAHPMDATAAGPITATQCSTANAKDGAVDFAFQNNSSKTATTVGFLIADAGVTRASFSYKGTYSPGASLSYRVQDNRLKPITDPAAVTCFISFVQYEDGSIWHATTGLQNILEQPNSPVSIETCNIENLAAAFAGDATKKAPGYNLIATASFKNASAKILSAVRIHFDVYDAFDSRLTAVTGTAYGHFSPNALIEPMRRGQAYVYTPSSPAWHFTIAWSGISPSDAAQTKCWVQDARFEDGTVWRAGSRLQVMPEVTEPPSTPSPFSRAE